MFSESHAMALSPVRLYLQTPAVTRGYVTACVLTTAAVVSTPHRGQVGGQVLCLAVGLMSMNCVFWWRLLIKGEPYVSMEMMLGFKVLKCYFRVLNVYIMRDSFFFSSSLVRVRIRTTFITSYCTSTHTSTILGWLGFLNIALTILEKINEDNIQ